MMYNFPVVYSTRVTYVPVGILDFETVEISDTAVDNYAVSYSCSAEVMKQCDAVCGLHASYAAVYVMYAPNSILCAECPPTMLPTCTQLVLYTDHLRDFTAR